MAQGKHPVSIELLLISFVMIAALLSAQWLISTPQKRVSGTFFTINRYSALIFGFILVVAIAMSLALRKVGFGFIILILAGSLYGELVRNTLSVEDRENPGTTDRRIYVMSNLIIVFSVLFGIILSLMYILERVGLASDM